MGVLITEEDTVNNEIERPMTYKANGSDTKDCKSKKGCPRLQWIK